VKRLLYLALFIFGVYLGLPGNTALPYQVQGRANAQSDPLLRIDVYHVATGQVIHLELEEYIKGVVASEMPATFSSESLKAQAVVARTNAVRKMRVLGGTPSLPEKGADVSSDYRVDQAWNPTETLRQLWGPVSFWLNWPKIEKAVEETRGVILMYNGSPCEAVFHSTCGGHTEAARDVWVGDVPYLQSVECSFCAHSPYYKPQTVTIPLSQVSASLSDLGVSVPASKITSSTIGVSQVSPTGRIKQVTVNGQTIRGLEFRMSLNLRSTLLSWTVRGQNAIFQVKGYGHGVGMCQYGADGMARQGRTFREILAHYYPGTQLAGIFEE
jgi:stage II sporulation protein D